jgi:GntR family transcriptional regulator
MEAMKIQKNSAIPLHVQLKYLLSERIEKGFYEDSRLPPEVEIAAQFNLSRTTVRMAMDALVKDGIITRQRGRGSFIISNKTSILGGSFYSLYDDFRASNRSIDTRVISFAVQTAPINVFQLFNLPDPYKFYVTDLLRITDGYNFLLATVYVPCLPDYTITPALFEQHGSAINLLEEEYHIKIVGASRSIEAVKSTLYEAKLLDVEVDDPLLLTKTIIYDDKGDPVYFAKSRYRADRYQYYIPFLPREPIQSALIERNK